MTGDGPTFADDLRRTEFATDLTTDPAVVELILLFIFELSPQPMNLGILKAVTQIQVKLMWMILIENGVTPAMAYILHKFDPMMASRRIVVVTQKRSKLLPWIFRVEISFLRSVMQ